MFLVRFNLVDGEMVEDPDGPWCHIDLVDHVVNNLQQEVILLKTKLDLIEEHGIDAEED